MDFKYEHCPGNFNGVFSDLGTCRSHGWLVRAWPVDLFPDGECCVIRLDVVNCFASVLLRTVFV